MKKICECCGKEFETSQPAKQLCDNKHYKTCAVCGKKFEVNKRNWKTKNCCCALCKQEWYRRTGKMQEMHQKTEQTKRQRYYDKGITFNVPKQTRVCVICGKEFRPTQSNQKCCEDKHYKTCVICGKPFEVNIRNYDTRTTCDLKQCKYIQAANTCEAVYGVKNAMHNPDCVQKRNDTCLERYGTNTVLSSEYFKSKCKQTCLSRYGVPFVSQNEEIKKKRMKTNLKRYGVPWFCMTPEYQDSRHLGRISKTNLAFKQLLDSYGVDNSLEYVVENRIYDFKCSGVLIEIDPTFTHNSYVNCYAKHNNFEGKPADYHVKKTQLANEYGFRCIHVWDWDDWDKVVHVVTPKNKIYARKCLIQEITQKQANEFLSEYHLQGSAKGQTKCYGLFFNDELVQAMTFGKPRYNKNFQWELVRLCSKSDVTVVGGSDRLFKRFVRENNPESIISYCDKSKFSGDVYEKLGFKLESKGKPSKHWYSYKKSEKMQHITDNLLRQRGFDQLFNGHYGKGTDNEQLMIERGYLPVYDCGQMRFSWYRTV